MHLWSLGLNDLIFHHFIPFKADQQLRFCFITLCPYYDYEYIFIAAINSN